VAGRARSRSWRNVHSCQRESCGAVVESCRCPTHRGVASGTVRHGKSGSGCGVRRGVGVLPVRQMAAGSSARGRRDKQRVVITDVTKIAGHSRVAIREREASARVIEDAGGPCGDGMA